ncbi:MULTISPECIES: hypothetical protein [unclassified Rhizobium]|uniref:hypothetical protein n=1 Tax=unclassified Rhizobium TaxID=2613769 RepID=UPI00161A79FE|nr:MULTISPECIES: hypothetical protein [unclassified Rhizobium]MBB3545109.1 hypothetical protein [Rhizobium sp. BK399]MCS3743868.1 hypothetical protein [Rhizobium sp. BK661]MCS4095962.1 hypothetical protein [Rhizobium sp. BK176]
MSLARAGFVLAMVARDYDVGLHAVRRALDLNTGAGYVVFTAAAALVFGGDPSEAFGLAEHAMALSPLDSGRFMFLTIAALAALFSGRLEQAIGHN